MDTNDNIKGIVDFIDNKNIGGWVKLLHIRSSQKITPPIIQVYLDNNCIANGEANIIRKDIESPNWSRGFKINIDLFDKEFKKSNLKIYVKYEDTKTLLPFYKPIEIGLEINELKEKEINVLASTANKKIFNVNHYINSFYEENSSKFATQELAILSHAHDSTGWFPYFYQYYSRLVGNKGIYIFTPNPVSFYDYKLGGIITYDNFVFDNTLKSMFISKLSSTLRNVYKKILVCDVDEIVMPHPNTKMNLIEFLRYSEDPVIFSFGFDVVQDTDEDSFNFDKDIFSQRNLIIPMNAESKPHISSVDIVYSDGYHGCNFLPKIQDPFNSLLTLHLKLACKKISNSIHKMISNSVFFDQNRKKYVLQFSGEGNIFFKEIDKYKKIKVPLYNDIYKDYYKKWIDNFRFIPSNGIWLSDTTRATFSIQI